MERLAAVVVLVLGGLVLLATALSLAVGAWDTTVSKALVLLLVMIGMGRAVSHLRRPSSVL